MANNREISQFAGLVTVNDTTNQVSLGSTVSISGGGDFGVGTDTPTFSNGSGLEITRSGTSCMRIEGNNENHAFEIYANSDGGTIDARGSNANMMFDIGGSEKARISAQGNLLVGTATTNSTGMAGQLPKFTVSGYADLGTLRINGADLANQIYYDVDDFNISVLGTNADMRIKTTRHLYVGTASNSKYFRFGDDNVFSVGNVSSPGTSGAKIYINPNDADDTVYFSAQQPGTFSFFQLFTMGTSVATPSATSTAMKIWKSASTSRSINASGTINASGADYAEYMIKCGEFTLAKGDICGIDADGKLTNVFADAISFAVKTTDPAYVGGDIWGTEDVIGKKPEKETFEPSENETYEEALESWKERLETEREKVDRVAFAGQVPVNVTVATPGQYIVPVVTESGGITGVAKNKSDMTASEYMDAVGKVIKITEDGRAYIIVKVA